MTKREKQLRKQRWRTALHEGAHVVADRELLFDEPTAAFVLECGAGYVIPGSPGKPLGFREAVCSACGGLAERLARKFPPPSEEPDLPTFAAHAEAAGVLTWRHVSETPAVASDGERVARWCTKPLRGIPSGPKEWAERYNNVYKAARRLIRENAQEISRIARELFLKGTYRRQSR